MDISPLSWPFSLPAPFPFYLSHLPRPDNCVHWSQSPDHHAFSADLPGVWKEGIRVELEDARYLIIRTERGDGEEGRFMRKFRLRERIDVDGIATGYENGVLTVTVPRTHIRRRLWIDLADLPDVRDPLVARAA